MADYIEPSGFFGGTQYNDAAVVGGQTGIFIPHSSLTSYGTGANDIRELVFSILEVAANGLDGIPSENKPTKLTISKSSSLVDSNTLSRSYVVNTVLNIGNITLDVEDETVDTTVPTTTTTAAP